MHVMPDGYDLYTCATCGHSQRDHWHLVRRDLDRSYCNIWECECYHFVMKRVGEEES